MCYLLFGLYQRTECMISTLSRHKFCTEKSKKQELISEIPKAGFKFNAAQTF